MKQCWQAGENRVKGRQNRYYNSKPTELAFLKFDLDAGTYSTAPQPTITNFSSLFWPKDLEALFNWNTKQVFAYLTVSYPGIKYELNDAVIWDIIIPSKSAAKLELRNQRAKYTISDITNKYREQNATLSFGWNVQPHVGALIWNEKGMGTFSFPPLKPKKNSGTAHKWDSTLDTSAMFW